MKRIIVPFVAAFVISLGGATGVVMMRAPKAPPAPSGAVAKVSDSTTVVKDSGAAQAQDSSGTADTTASTAPAGATGTQAAASIAPATKSHEIPASGGTAPSTKLAAGPAVAHPVSPEPPRPISDSLINRRLAKVFAAMQAKDAARVLEQMNDSDVRAILGSLSSKQQAAILGSFPTQRAALIVQTTLRTGTSGGAQ